MSVRSSRAVHGIAHRLVLTPGLSEMLLTGVLGLARDCGDAGHVGRGRYRDKTGEDSTARDWDGETAAYKGRF
ncbi:MAG: hypothetical protein ACKOEO_03405 [Planctomycetaceae bacterium]